LPSDQTAACQIYLVTPPGPDPAAFAPALTAALDAAPVACVLLLPGDLDEAGLRQAIDALRPIVQERGIAFMIDGHPNLAAATGCDGVHTCPVNPPYEVCRQAVGPQAIVGYSCRNSRHDAMVVAEEGADYIVFGHMHPSPEQTAETRELIGWWAETMEVPCVALDRITAANAAEWARQGADFVTAGPDLWDDPRGPAVALAKIARSIGLMG
jgi:thiamine-phosphate pyrophosphorylase